MKLKIDFGMWDGSEYVSWHKTIGEFPRLLRYMSDVYEFVMYKKENIGYSVDYTFSFTKTQKYTQKYNDIPIFKEMFAHCFIKSTDCHYGAKYDKGNPNHHMVFCPKSKK